VFIAIEGSDGSGKSSLIEAIKTEVYRQRPNAEFITMHHKGRPPEETRECLLNEYVLSIESCNLQNEIHLADRWHWGERTYAPIKRPHTNADGYGLLGIAGWRWVELFMQSRGMAQFLLYQNLETIKTRVNSRGDDFVDVSELEAIYKAYTETSKVAVIAETLLPGDASLDELPAFASHIIDVASAISKRASFLQKFPQYIGPIKPKVLLIGSEQEETNTVLPFVPTANSDGDFLLSSLPADLWKHVGIVNAQKISPFDLSELHRALGNPPIAALGKIAVRSILKSTIYVDDYVTIPHPQAVQDYADAYKKQYGEVIQDISNNIEPSSKWRLS
jgi:hypothetical protein